MAVSEQQTLARGPGRRKPGEKELREQEVRHGWLGLIVQDAAGVLRELVADSHLLAAQRRVCLRDPDTGAM